MTANHQLQPEQRAEKGLSHQAISGNTLRRSEMGWPRSSIDEINARLGYDVRQLPMMSYSDGHVWRVLRQEMTVCSVVNRAGRPRLTSRELSCKLPGKRKACWLRP